MGLFGQFSRCFLQVFFFVAVSALELKNDFYRVKLSCIVCVNLVCAYKVPIFFQEVVVSYYVVSTCTREHSIIEHKHVSLTFLTN